MYENVIAVSHPGKMGDALYALPATKILCEEWDSTADFYTSEYCKPILRLVEYQPYIRSVIIPPAYEILRRDIGIQPWQMPISKHAYHKIVHMGFRCVPHTNIPEFICLQVGAPIDKLGKIEYTYPEVDTLDEPYICIAARGNTTYLDLFRSIAHNSPVAVVVIGGPIDSITDEKYTNHNKPIIDLTGLDMLETTSWLSKCVGFVGLMSAMLVLANGFDMPKIVPHDGIHWDMRHVVRTPTHKYLVLPTLQDVFGGLGL